VKRALFIMLAIACLASLCHAETRWCSITGQTATDKLVYPPIARAARMTGTVVTRITFLPNGKVTSAETIFGKVLLADSVKSQFKDWTIPTDSQGNEECMGLIIADFSLDDQNPDKPPAAPAIGILRISIKAETFVLDTNVSKT